MTVCALCTYAGTSWHCGSCHRSFGGLSAFDLHREGMRCTDPTALRTPLRLVDGVYHFPPSSRAPWRTRCGATSTSR